MSFLFTHDFTGPLKKSLNCIYSKKPSDEMICVEIGSYEGRGSMLICDFLCENINSKLYCIDPFDDEYVKGKESTAFWNNDCVGQLARFRNNTKQYSKIIEYKGTSDEMINKLENNSVDFVFIDGDHSPDQVYKDAVNMFEKMKKNGVILFDDYLWTTNGIITKDGIDKFLKEYDGKYILLIKNYQLGIRII